MTDLLAWQAIIALTTATFTRPSFELFSQIVSGWVLCPVRRTITRILPTADPDREHAHDAFHRLFRDAAWETCLLWRSLVIPLVSELCSPPLPLLLLVDDTLVHKTGRNVNGAGVFRDAVRSTKRKIVYALGLNIVVLCLCVRVPFSDQPLALPVNFRLYRKGGASHVALTVEMLQELTKWLPEHRFTLVGDGAYAPLAKCDLPRTHVRSRMRHDAALFDFPAPRRPGQRGPTRKKGDRLPKLPQMATQTSSNQWKLTEVRLRGRTVKRLLFSRRVLWYYVTGGTPLLLVIVRDPERHEHDDFLFTTEIDADPATVASQYAARWAIEVSFRDIKQCLTPHHPQSWRRHGPERTVMTGVWLQSAVWLWFIRIWRHGTRSWPDRPWYTRKCSPSFADALISLRAVLWRERLSPISAAVPNLVEWSEALVWSLARAG